MYGILDISSYGKIDVDTWNIQVNDKLDQHTWRRMFMLAG